MDETTITVQLGTESVTLQRPDDMFERWEVQELGATSLPRARGAALGLCWRGLKRPKVRPESFPNDLGAYGAAVIRELLEEGYPKLHILRAGSEAFALCARGVLTMEDVRAAEGNSEGGESSPG